MYTIISSLTRSATVCTSLDSAAVKGLYQEAVASEACNKRLLAVRTVIRVRQWADNLTVASAARFSVCYCFRC
jgi:hypothetical protein